MSPSTIRLISKDLRSNTTADKILPDGVLLFSGAKSLPMYGASVPSHVAGFFEVPPGKLTTIELTDRAVERSDTFAFALTGVYKCWLWYGDRARGVLAGGFKTSWKEDLCGWGSERSEAPRKVDWER